MHVLGISREFPGVFYAFRPQRIEKLIWQKDASEGNLEELERRGITPVIIPDGDLDHDPKTGLKPKEEDKSQRLFQSMRENIIEG